MKIEFRTIVTITDENYVEVENYCAVTSGNVSEMKSLMDLHNEKVGSLERKLLK